MAYEVKEVIKYHLVAIFYFLQLVIMNFFYFRYFIFIQNDFKKNFMILFKDLEIIPPTLFYYYLTQVTKHSNLQLNYLAKIMVNKNLLNPYQLNN